MRVGQHQQRRAKGQRRAVGADAPIENHPLQSGQGQLQQNQPVDAAPVRNASGRSAGDRGDRSARRRSARPALRTAPRRENSRWSRLRARGDRRSRRLPPAPPLAPAATTRYSENRRAAAAAGTRLPARESAARSCVELPESDLASAMPPFCTSRSASRRAAAIIAVKCQNRQGSGVRARRVRRRAGLPQPRPALTRLVSRAQRGRG
ncbi:MAG: hypothetical protein KatS3mg051_0761 [Anaerolineae bacterium]|nr:MAG: hypothetical protein KatS3mg051_0761 [Anaerolineae bacterium]